MFRSLFPSYRRKQRRESQTVRRSDLDLNEPAVVLDAGNPAIAHRYRRLLALYVASNNVRNQNKIWSWKEFGSKL